MTTVLRLCPKCGAEIPSDAPEGVCPCCLLKAGFSPLAETVVAAGDASTITATEAGDGGSAEKVEANAAAAADQSKKAASAADTLGELGDY